MIIVIDNINFYLYKNHRYYWSSKVRRFLHQYIWEKHNKISIPKGYEIHHIDFNSFNNDIVNLRLMLKSEHRRLHALVISEDTKIKQRANLAKIRPLTKEWHKSEAGKHWHRNHYVNNKDKLRKKYLKKCEMCESIFEGLSISKFCSNKCKSRYRRAIGIDNIEFICHQCGIRFSANKYKRQKYCSNKCALQNLNNGGV